MSDDDLNELERPETWDFEGAEKHPPVKKARAVVSVAFPRDDFEGASQCAEKSGLRVSEFIREATREKIARLTVRPVGCSAVTSLSGPFIGAVFINGKLALAGPGVTRSAMFKWFPARPETSPQAGGVGDLFGETVTA